MRLSISRWRRRTNRGWRLTKQTLKGFSQSLKELGTEQFPLGLLLKFVKIVVNELLLREIEGVVESALSDNSRLKEPLLDQRWTLRVSLQDLLLDLLDEKPDGPRSENVQFFVCVQILI